MFGCSQPAFSDITGSITSAQCVAATGAAIGCVKPDNTTITISAGIISTTGVANSIDAGGATSVTNCGTPNAQLVNTGTNKVGCVTGTWVLLATLTASSSANLSDTTSINSTYRDYKIVFENLVAASGSPQCIILIHSNGAFQTANYVGSAQQTNGSASGTFTSTTGIPCGPGGDAIAITAPGLGGEIIILNAPATTSQKWVNVPDVHYLNSGAAVRWTSGASFWNGTGAATNPVDGIEFCFGTTPPTCSINITSGQMKIYGRL